MLLKSFLCSLLLAMTVAVGVAADPADRLAEQYRSAHRAGDLAALQGLVYWEGASDRTREMITDRLQKHFGHDIEVIEFRPLRADHTINLPAGYAPNLKPLGYLAIEFHDPADEYRFRGVSFVVGEHNGVYLITVARRQR